MITSDHRALKFHDVFYNETTEKETRSTTTTSEENDKKMKNNKRHNMSCTQYISSSQCAKFNRKKNELEEGIAKWLSYAVPKDSIKMHSYKKIEHELKIGRVCNA